MFIKTREVGKFPTSMGSFLIAYHDLPVSYAFTKHFINLEENQPLSTRIHVLFTGKTKDGKGFSFPLWAYEKDVWNATKMNCAMKEQIMHFALYAGCSRMVSDIPALLKTAMLSVVQPLDEMGCLLCMVCIL
jgi:hypothetical protein